MLAKPARKEREMSPSKGSRQKGRRRAMQDDYRILFLRTAHPMWVFDVCTLRFLAVNDAAVRLYGYSQQEFLSMTVADLHAPEDVAAVTEKLRSAGNRPCHGLYRHRPRAAIAADITARRHAENALRETNQTVGALIEALPLAVIGLDFDGKVVGWNRAAREMFGWAEAEALGKPLPIVPEDQVDHFRDELERAKRGESLAGIERQAVTRDGSVIDIVLWTAVQRDISGAPTGVISAFRNSFASRRRWRPSGAWPAASRTTSTTCSPS
jgi:PAS domain S-box-containing protein